MCTTTIGNERVIKTAKPIALIIGFVLATSCIGFAGAAEAGSAAEITAQHAVPLHHLYWHFLRFQRHLDKRADALEQEGRTQDAATVRNHLQKDLKFTDAQMALVRQAGLRLEKNLEVIRAQIRPIIYEDLQWRKLHGRSAGPPPGAGQVHASQKQHEAAILNAVAQLNQQLGPEAAARLRAYVDSHVTGHKIHPRAHNPKIDSNAASHSHMEARQ
jgi:hypothetical protein